MNVSDRDRMQELAKARAEALEWHGRQVAVCRMALGPLWRYMAPMIALHLKDELRDRLITLGWEPPHGR